VLNHRYIGYEGLVQAAADVQQAIRFLAANGANLGINSANFAVWAFSGAGMLLSPLLDGGTAGLRCVVAFYPMLDLTHVRQASEVYDEQQLIALSPLAHMETMPGTLPLFLARAGLDLPGLNRALDTFVKQALYHNMDLEVRNLPRAGHGFDLLEETPAARETIAHGIEFVRSNLQDHEPGLA
jgi:acetyl esterase/lipase